MRYIVLLLVTGALGCAVPLDPSRVGVNPVPFLAPSSYTKWWSEVQDCSRASNTRLEEIEWLLVDEIRAGVGAVGAWLAPHTVLLRRGYQFSKPTVQHEMLHDQLQDHEHTHACFRRWP